MNKNNSLKELEEIEEKILIESEKICKDFSIDTKLLMFLKNGKKLRSKLLILSGNIKNKKKRRNKSLSFWDKSLLMPEKLKTG